MKWLSALNLNKEQNKVITENVEKIETNHKKELESNEADYKIQLQNTREATEKRISKKMVPLEDHETIKSKLNEFEKKELNTHLDTLLKDLPIKKDFIDDVKEKIASTINYDGIEDSKAKAKHFVRNTEMFLNKAENARFKETGQESLTPNLDQNNNSQNIENKKEQAQADYASAFEDAAHTK